MTSLSSSLLPFVVFMHVTSINIIASQSVMDIKLPVIGDDVTVTCGNQQISLTVTSEYMTKSSHWLDGGRLCLADRSCRGHETDTGNVIVNVTNNFMQCGNKVSIIQNVNGSSGTLQASYYQFTNKLIYDGGSSSIDRDINLVQFNCLYPTTQTQITFNKENEVYERVIKITDVGGEISLVEEVEIIADVEDDDSMEDIKFVQIRLAEPQLPSNLDTSSFQYKAVASQCWLANDDANYEFLEDGCPTVDENIFSFVESADDLTINFRLLASHFSDPKQPFSIHCIVGACNAIDGDCSPTCGSSKRKRRSVQVKKIDDFSVEIEPREFVLHLNVVTDPTIANTSVVTETTEDEIEEEIIKETEEKIKSNDTLLIALVVSIVTVLVIILALTTILCVHWKGDIQSICCC